MKTGKQNLEEKVIEQQLWHLGKKIKDAKKASEQGKLQFPNSTISYN